MGGCGDARGQRARGREGRRKKEADGVEIGLLGKEKRRRGEKKPQRLPEGDVRKTNKHGRRGKEAKARESYCSERSSY